MKDDTQIKSAPKVERKVMSALKNSDRAATVADVVAATSLPIREVESTLKRMLDEYRGALRVTETGELLYYFPQGFRSASTGFLPRLKRAARRAGGAVLRTARFLFKIWIVVMLVGYFALFLALLVAAVVASTAASVAGRGNDSRSRGRGGGFGLFYLSTRLLQTFFFLWVYSSPGKTRKRRGRPLHQSVFAYVFGEGDPNREWEENARKAIIRHIQRHRGIVTTYEVASMTGLPLAESQAMIHRMLREYDGDPGVTDDGTLYYAFPGLMARSETEIDRARSHNGAPKKQLMPFNRNPKKLNRWIGFFNGFNLIFGAYFLTFANVAIPRVGEPAGIGSFALIVRQLLSFIPNPVLFMFYGLGVVPIVFSVLFFCTTATRRYRERARNRAARNDNFRRRVFASVVDRPERLRLDSIVPTNDDERADEPDRIRDEVVVELQTLGDVTISEEPNGALLYDFTELGRSQRDIASFRESINPRDFDIGSVIYDSGSDASTS